MARRLLMINAVLGLVAAGFVTYIVWELTRPLSDPKPLRPRAISSPGPSALPGPTGREGGPGAWTTVASRNLFSPTRSDTGSGTGAAMAPLGPKPNLYGVVLRDGAPIAYLEDPVTRRVSAYRVGDTVAGGVVQSITADGVMLTRPDGQIDVRLHDPAKPRPPAPPVPGVAPPGAQVQPPVEAQPVLPPAGQLAPPQGPQLPRRPIPPNLIRRLPQTSPAEAPPQGNAPNQ